MRLGKDIGKKQVFKVKCISGDPGGTFKTLEKANKFIKETMYTYDVERDNFVIYLLIETKQEVLE